MNIPSSRFSLVRGGALGVLALLALFAACQAELPTDEQINGMDVAGAESAAQQVKLLDPDDGTVVYSLDGAPITAEQARALKGEQIGAINIQRTDSASWVRITSRTKADDGGRAAAVTRPGTTEFDGLLLVDGVKMASSELHSVPPDRIESIEVMKGPTATRLYSDPAAARGVIRITTKGAARAN